MVPAPARQQLEAAEMRARRFHDRFLAVPFPVKDRWWPNASICASRLDRTMASSSGPMVDQCMVRSEILRPDWKASRLEINSNARMRAVGSPSGVASTRAINRAVTSTPGRQSLSYRISNGEFFKMAAGVEGAPSALAAGGLLPRSLRRRYQPTRTGLLLCGD
jgi:hypothetical protein